MRILPAMMTKDTGRVSTTASLEVEKSTAERSGILFGGYGTRLSDTVAILGDLVVWNLNRAGDGRTRQAGTTRGRHRYVLVGWRLFVRPEAGRSVPGDDLARYILMGSTDDRSIAEVIKSLGTDFAQLVRDEIALAKNEMQGSIARIGTGAGLFGGAGIVGLFAVEFLLLALMFGLIALGVHAWLSALIVSIVLFVIGAVLAMSGKKAVSNINVVPTHTIEHVKADVAAIKADIDQARRK